MKVVRLGSGCWEKFKESFVRVFYRVEGLRDGGLYVRCQTCLSGQGDFIDISKGPGFNPASITDSTSAPSGSTAMISIPLDDLSSDPLRS